MGRKVRVEEDAAIDMTPMDGSDNYRITMRFAVGCQIGFTGDCAYFIDAV